MQIKRRSKTSAFSVFFKGRTALFMVIFVVYSCSLIMGGVMMRGYLSREVIPVVKATLNGTLIRNAINGFFAQPERIIIDIKHENYVKLVQKRQEALSQGYLLSTDDDYVPGSIRYQGEEVRVALRLKGRMTDHLDDRTKWSMRVRVKGGNTLFGMRKFSLQHPKVRNYVNEWIFHEALKREGIASLRYKFVQVTLNGKNLGIYALEEHFDKRLIESNERREGPILRFDESLTWGNFVYYGNREKVGGSYSAQISAHNLGQLKKSEALWESYVHAAGLLEKARQGEMAYADILDVPLFAKYYALQDLLGGQHSGSGLNFRLYFNPVTARFEPIGFDADAGQKSVFLYGERFALYPNDDLNWLHLWTDKVFFAAYLKELERVQATEYLDKLFDDLGPQLDKNIAVLHKNFPLYIFSKQNYLANQDYIRKTLKPTKALHTYFHGVDSKSVVLKVANVQFLPLEISHLSYDGQVLKPVSSYVIEPRMRYRVMSFDELQFNLPEDLLKTQMDPTLLKIHYKMLGGEQILEDSVYARSHFDQGVVSKDLVRQQSNYQEFDFITVNENSKQISIKPGSWQISKNVIIPAGYTVHANPGTQLTLSSDATVLSYSPLIFKGDLERPIVIRSGETSGQGLLVLHAKSNSLMEHVHFVRLTNPDKGSWTLTGAVTFYESPVRFEHCQFLESRAEDALNIIRSDFTITKSLFGSAGFDALDVDFGRGVILDTNFVATGNDAIDVSGTDVRIENISIKSTGDKAISVGEKSYMRADNVHVEDAEIGVASKDLSQVDVTDMQLAQTRVGLTVFQKKPEFGPGQIIADGLEMGEAELPFVVETGSLLKIGGSWVEPNFQDAKKIFYGAMYGKSSR